LQHAYLLVSSVESSVVKLCGNGWERSSHTYFPSGNSVPTLPFVGSGNAGNGVTFSNRVGFGKA